MSAAKRPVSVGHLTHVEVHLAVLVREDAIAAHLVQQLVGLGLVIPLLHPEQHQQPLADGPGHLSLYRYAGLADPLNQCNHIPLLSKQHDRPSCGMSGRRCYQ